MLARHSIEYPSLNHRPTFKTPLSLITLPRPETAAMHAPLTLSPKINRPCSIKHSSTQTLPVHMAFSCKIGFVSGVSAHSRTKELPKRRRTANSDGILVHSATLPGTGFKNPPPLAISSNLLQFLKCMDLKSVGLGLDCVPFQSGWELVG